MGIDLTPRCKKCGCELDLKSMRALPEGKGFICQNCYEIGDRPSFTVNKNRLREPTSNNSNQENLNDQVGAGDKIFNEKEYECSSCGYKFKKPGDAKVEICPYCGKRDVVHQKVEESADTFLG